MDDRHEEQSPRRPSKRPRVLVACQRCKRRRQKCDNASPACSNCARAKAECVYNENAYPPSYVNMLEERLRQLEAKLGDRTSEAPLDQRRGDAPVGDRSVSVDQVSTESGSGRRPEKLAVGVGLLSSCAAAEPHYFGFSAGLSLAHFVQVAIDFGPSSTAVSLPLLADRPFSNQVLNGDTSPAGPPSFKSGASYIRAYLSKIHPLYPFLRRTQLWQLHSSLTRRQTQEHSQVDLALMHLVYAIGSRCLQLLGKLKSSDSSPEGHFLSAMKLINDGLKFTSIRSIEVTLLLAIHSMRSPSGSSVWHLSGLAIRQCLELGLHKQRNMDARYNGYIQHRKCIFWSAYIFERKTSLVLGRPFALSDEEIDVEMPFNVSDDQDEDKNLAPVAQSSPLIESPERTTLSYHRAHIQLYQIHTKLRLVLHQMKRSKTKDEVKEVITTLFARLEDWRTQVLDSFDTSQASSSNSRNTRRRQASPDNDSDSSNSNPDVHLRPVEVEKAELLLEYYKARRSLLQPLMTDGRDHYPFDKSDYIACADASGQICQLHRRLHRLSPIPFSLRDLHAVFVAGFTLIYCICSCPEIYSASRASDIGACSTVLYVITEQWPSAKKYRDAFELVAEKMMESTRDPGLENPMIAGGTGDFDGHVQPHGDPSESIGVVSVSGEYHAGTGGSFPPRSISIAGILNSDVFFHSDAEAPSSSGLGLDLDLETDLYDIEGLLTNEGLDWFTGATI